ncbi:MAG: hypothetical protein BWY65_02105 [Firmicutes bacterium ADurb.Bin373]|nr:MAG: hypothetical protein BWY65_02105 [Firmicutes bacterium ADurb.Bin373]
MSPVVQRFSQNDGKNQQQEPYGFCIVLQPFRLSNHPPQKTANYAENNQYDKQIFDQEVQRVVSHERDAGVKESFSGHIGNTRQKDHKTIHDESVA